MVSVEPIKPSRRRRQTPNFCGKLPIVDMDTLSRIAERQAKGFPLALALSLEPEPLTVAHWNNQLEQAPRLARLYTQKLALGLTPFIEMMGDPSRNLRNMPAMIWIMERIFPQWFAQPKHFDPNGPSVTNNILIQGVSDADVLRRASKLIRDATRSIEDTPRVKAMKARRAAKSKAIEVSSTVSPASSPPDITPQ